LPMMFLSAADVTLRKVVGVTIPGTVQRWQPKRERRSPPGGVFKGPKKREATGDGSQTFR
jgi:hypothetical protein